MHAMLGLIVVTTSDSMCVSICCDNVAVSTTITTSGVVYDFPSFSMDSDLDSGPGEILDCICWVFEQQWSVMKDMVLTSYCIYQE